MTKYIMYHRESGVYLGSALGLGFWSKLDDVDQPSAIVFDSPEDAKEFTSTWDNQIPDLEYIPVETSGNYIAKELIAEYW